MTRKLRRWAREEAPGLADKHWHAVEAAVQDGVGYICSDFETGELTAEQCCALLACRDKIVDELSTAQFLGVRALVHGLKIWTHRNDTLSALQRRGLATSVSGSRIELTPLGRAVLRVLLEANR